MRMMLFLAVMASACAQADTDVVLRFPADATAEFRTYVTLGAQAWHELGYQVSPASGRPDCTADRHDCSITVDIERQDLGPDVAALSTPQSVTFHVRLEATTYEEKLELWAVAAHELGHVLLDVEHLAPGIAGVMAQPPTTHEPTPADFDLACSAGRC